MKVPCKGCLLVPLCKHRTYSDLFEHCSLLQEYEPSPTMRLLRNHKRIEILERVLKPSKWYMRIEGLLIQPFIYNKKDQNNDSTM